MADSKKYNGSTWEHSLRKMTTATADIEPTIYTDGTAITAYTIKGNTVQNGTPTPSNPVEVNGVGERTANIIDTVPITAGSMASMNYENANNSQSIRCYGTSEAYTQRASTRGYTLPAGTYTLSFVSTRNDTRFFVQLRSSDGLTTYASTLENPTFTLNETSEVYPRVCGNFSSANPYTTDEVISIMLNTGSTALPYEPYGYKIPISSGGVTTPIYFSQQLYKIGDTTDNYVSSGTATYNIGWIDLGTLNWEILASGNFHSTTIITDMKLITNGEKGNAICTAFSEIEPQNVANTPYSFSSCLNTQRTPFVNKTGFEGMTAAQFKAAMSGVIMYYVKAEATTETVTAPSIPTTEGANSITVDTTVQPSEFTATWTGWHDAYVKEKSENLIFKTLPSANINSNGTIVNDSSSEFDLFVAKISQDTAYSGNGWVYAFYSTEPSVGSTSYDSTRYAQTPTNVTAPIDGYIVMRANHGAQNVMLNEGGTALPYEPYWK